MRKKAAVDTLGSPYLMQLIGHYITKYATDEGVIDEDSFTEALINARSVFENDICGTALVSLSGMDIRFLTALAEDDGTTKLSDLAKRLNVSPAYVQLYKRRLKEAGAIGQVRRGEIQLEIPYLKDYLRKEEF